jgi:hypothetical protein
MKLYFGLVLFFLSLAAPALSARAEDGADSKPMQESSGAFPPSCDFTISFPEKPYVARRCKGRSGSECYDVFVYTRVFDLSNAVTVEATCNPVSPDMAVRLSEEAMKATLEAMVGRKSVGQYDLKVSERDGVRSATLFGEGVKGVAPTLYVAQLWLGTSSLLTVEAELTGDANPQADSLFSEVLKSIRAKGASASAQGEEKTEQKGEFSEEEKAVGSKAPAKKSGK